MTGEANATQAELPVWTGGAGWIEAVTAWVDRVLSAQGRVRSGPLTLHKVKPWAVIAQVSTARVRLFFKAGAPVMSGEAGVLGVLTRVCPERTVEVVGLDAEREWVLSVDGGQTLREAGGDLDAWCAMAGAFAALQADTAAWAEALVEAGARDGRLDAMPGWFDALLQARDLLASGPQALSDAEAEQLAALRPVLVARCAQLASGPLPSACLVHNDLHDGNVFVRREGSSPRFRFFDWGDSLVGYPLMDGLLMTRVAEVRLDLDADGVDRVRHAYLAPWAAAYGVRIEALTPALQAAMPLGALGLAMDWLRIARSPDGGDWEASAVARWARRLLDELAAPAPHADGGHAS